ncbi:MAG: LacI family transcriptional regulator [Spirochaetaceae bacterium]
MKVTIKDIAAVAGVSHSTVSRALNDSNQISTATKEKIKNIAKSLNFEFNSGARSLKSSKTGNIAVVYDANDDQFGSSLYISQLFLELRHYLERMDMDVILLEAYHPESGASNIDRLLRQQKVDGFLMVHDHISKKDYTSIQMVGIPIVQLHMMPRFFDKNKLDYFITDHIQGGRLATKHLVKKGCKKILTVFPDDIHSEEYPSRTRGYKDVLVENSLEVKDEYLISLPCTYNAGYNLLKTAPEIIKEVDGIFFQTDIQAFGFMNAAAISGIKIPQDIKVIGYDDAPVCESTSPKLTTIYQPRKELAKYASERIIDLINKKDDEIKVQKMIDTSIVLREST